MNLIPRRLRRDPRRAAQDAYFAIDETPRADTARDTLRHSSDPAQRGHALAILAERELGLYRTHDDAFGHQPWTGDIAGDAETGLAYGSMALRLLLAAEAARTSASWLPPGTHDSWNSHWEPAAWVRADLRDTETDLADACSALLTELAATNDPTEQAVLYTRLWIAAYPVIGGQAAEWIAVLGNDWQCRAAGVQDGSEAVLVLPDAGRCAVQYLPNTNPTPA